MFLFLALAGLLVGFVKIMSGITDLITKEQSFAESFLSILFGIIVLAISVGVIMYEIKKGKREAEEKAKKEAKRNDIINHLKAKKSQESNRIPKKHSSFEDDLLCALKESSKDPAFFQSMSGYAERRKILFEGQDYSDPNYGYDKLNPIVTSTIPMSNTYLNNLRTSNGCKFTWTRKGSCCVTVHDVPGTMVDCYQLSHDNAVYVIYISPYGIATSTHAPKGMLLVNDHDSMTVPSGSNNTPYATSDDAHESNSPVSSINNASDKDNSLDIEDDDYRDLIIQQAGIRLADTHAALLNSMTTNNKIHLFMDTYSDEILPVLKSSSLVHNTTFELLPAMFVVADFATAEKVGNRTEFAKAIVIYLTDAGFLNEDNTPTFHSRLALYGKIVRGETKPHGDWALADPKSLKKSLVGKVTVALGDILTNPACVDNYENTHLALHGLFELIDFYQNTMYPTYQKLMELYKSFS